MKRWEYKLLGLECVMPNYDAYTEDINELGKAGWEAVTVIPGWLTMNECLVGYVLFKRELVGWPIQLTEKREDK